MRHAARRLALLSTTTLLLAVDARAQEASGGSPPNEGAIFLLLPVGAKAVALGQAMTAMQGQESVFWNPAGLASLDRSRLVFIRGDHAIGTATAVSAVSVHPGLGTLAISYMLLDTGDQDYTDSDGNILGTLSLRNHLAIASMATRLLGRLDVGVNLKLFEYRYGCRGNCQSASTTATGYAMDAGVQLAPTRALPLRVAAMVAHLGPDFQVVNADQADPLPTRARVAVAYDVLSSLVARPDLSGWLTVEVQDGMRTPRATSLYVGSEVTAGTTQEALCLRAGYVTGNLDQQDGARVGLGLRFQRFDLSIAKSLAVSSLTGETEPVQVTLSVVF
jgi:hypothetical protein